MNKLYTRQIFNNDATPALNETNLNILTKAVDDIDDRVVSIAGIAERAETAAQTAEQAAEDAEDYAAEAAAGSGGNALEYTNSKLKLKRDSVVLSEVTISGGGGGGGTTNYNDLDNKPSIESVTLSGNKTAADLGLAKGSDVTSAYSNIYGISNAYNASSSYAPDDSEKPSMCIDENELYKCLVACQGIKPSTDTSGAWEKVTLAAMLSNFQNGVDSIYNSVVGRGLTPSSKTPSAISTTIAKLSRIYSMACTVRGNATSFTTMSPLSALSSGFTLSGNVFTYTGSNTATYTLYIRTFNGIYTATSAAARCYCRVYVNGAVVLTVNGDSSANTTNSGSVTGTISKNQSVYIQHHSNNAGNTVAYVVMQVTATS